MQVERTTKVTVSKAEVVRGLKLLYPLDITILSLPEDAEVATMGGVFTIKASNTKTNFQPNVVPVDHEADPA